MKLGTHKRVRRKGCVKAKWRSRSRATRQGSTQAAQEGWGRLNVSRRAGQGQVFSKFQAGIQKLSQTLSDTAMSWNINKAQGKTRPAIMISKKLFLSLRCCTTRMILHTLTHVHFYCRGSLTLLNGIVAHASQSSCTAHLNLQQLL